jgi:hypothetical protein
LEVSVGSALRVLVGLGREGLGDGVSAAVERVGEGSSIVAEGKLQASRSASSAVDKRTMRKNLVIGISTKGCPLGADTERYAYSTRWGSTGQVGGVLACVALEAVQ